MAPGKGQWQAVKPAKSAAGLLPQVSRLPVMAQLPQRSAWLCRLDRALHQGMHGLKYFKYLSACSAASALAASAKVAWISQCCRAVQVLTLAASISPGILKRGVTPQSVQEEVQHVLELQQYDAAGQQDTGSYQPFCMGPSALGVDDAISALQESVDWMRLRSYALPGGADSPAQMPYVNDRFESHACLLSKNSHFHLGHFSACGQIGHY